MQLLRSLIYWVGMALSTLVIAPVGVLLFPFPHTVRYHFIRLWALFNLRWLKFSCGLGYVVDGKENIPTDESFVVFCKHQSTWETMMLQELFPRHVWVLKKELLRIPVFGWGLAMLDPIAIDRSAGRKAIKQLIDQGTAALAQGRAVVIFPEGTRTAYGSKGQYHAGGAVLAEKSGAPVVPVAHDAGRFWPRHGFVKRPGTIRVSVGPVIPSAGRKASAILEDAENWIEGRMDELAALRTAEE